MKPSQDRFARAERFRAAFLKAYFRLLYHQLAWSYDLVAALVSVGLWSRWVASVLPYLPGPRVLEIGHGPGHLLADLAKNGKQAFGLDASPQMGRLVLRKIPGFKYFCGVVNGYAQYIPFSGAAFDQVVATFPAEFIFSPLTCAEVFRVLAPGGRFVLMPGAWITSRSPMYRLAAALFRIAGQAPSLAEIEALRHSEGQYYRHLVVPLQAAGFQVQIEILPTPESHVLLVLADKPGG